ncbi:hypothetical protein T06_10745 [Trichinella sp. T6]|nr:hypothetical protein T06_10745 [Trichinella sp. T6]
MKGTISGHSDSFKGGELLQYPGDRHFHQTVGQLCYLTSEHHGGH